MILSPIHGGADKLICFAINNDETPSVPVNCSGQFNGKPYRLIRSGDEGMSINDQTRFVVRVENG